MSVDRDMIQVEDIAEGLDTEEEEARFSDEQVEEMIQSLVSKSHITDSFQDIKLVSNPDLPVAYTNMETEEIIINTQSDRLDQEQLVNCVEGLLAHERGHMDDRFKAPGTAEHHLEQEEEVVNTVQEYIDDEGKAQKKARMLMNVVEDMEIHHQMLKRNRARPDTQRELRTLLTEHRNKIIEQGDTDSPFLSGEYEFTEEQEVINEIITNRNLSVKDKTQKIANVLLEEPPEDDGGGGNQGQGDDDKDDSGQGQPKVQKKGQNNSGNSKDDGDSPNQDEGEDEEDSGDEEEGSSSDGDDEEGDEDDEALAQGNKPGEDGGPNTWKDKEINELTAHGTPEQARDEYDIDTSDLDEGKSIKDEIEKSRKRKKTKRRLQQLGMSSKEAKDVIAENDINDLQDKISDLSNVLEDVLPALQSEKSEGESRDRTRPGGDKFDGYRSPRDVAEVVSSPVELLTTGEIDPEGVKVERKSHTRGTSGVVFILRDTSGSMTSGSKAKMARDATVSLIRTAKQHNHEVGVIDFSGTPEAHRDKTGDAITREYNTLMLDSMEMKSGGGTKLGKALEMVNQVVNEQNYNSVPINIYVVTDTEIFGIDADIEAKQPKLNTVWCDDGGELTEPMKELTDEYNGEIYRTKSMEDGELVSELYQSY